MSIEAIPGKQSPTELVALLMNAESFLRDRQRAHGDIFKTWMGFPAVFVVGPEANGIVHITGRDSFSYQKGYGELAIGRIFDGSLLLVDGLAHKHERDILQPAVGRLGLSQSLDRVLEIWQRAAERAQAKPDCDAYLYARDATFEVSANALVDVELNELASWRALFEKLIEGSMATVPIAIPGSRMARGLKARDALIDKLAPRIEAARRREPRGMLGLLAHHKDAEGRALSTRRIAEHVLLLFWAGYDTTASTGSWLLVKLAENPEWQERLLAEQKRVLGDRDMRIDDGEALVEHGWFLKEIERMCPAVLLFPRRSVENIEIHGHDIPSGTRVFWSPYMTHRLARIFDDPDRFDPLRWSPERGERQAKSTALVGFGGGPRICLGKAFAQLQLRVMMTTLIRRFRVELRGPVQPLLLPTYRPRVAPIRFVPRVPRETA